MLGLEKCKDTRVGGDLKRGVSGGEKKRTSVALELVTDPSVIFLDEPTTGLDSKSALDVAALLKMLAENGRTIITTIHQPSSEIMSRFDRIMCLCEGKIVFDGPPSDLIKYFNEVGLPAPMLTNPADHLMSILNDDDIKIKLLSQGKEISKEELRRQFLERLNKLVSHYKANKVQLVKARCSEQEYKELSTPPERPGVCYQAGLLLARSYKFFFRNQLAFATKVVQQVAFAIFSIILYTNIRTPEKDTIGSIQDVAGLVFNITGVLAFGGLFGSILGIIPQIPSFMREHEKRLYSPTLFYIISTLYHIPSQIFLVLFYQVMFFWVIDMRRGWESFWKYFIIFFTTYVSGSGFGDILSISVRNIELIN